MIRRSNASLVMALGRMPEKIPIYFFSCIKKPPTRIKAPQTVKDTHGRNR
jgi:hypothetical protein